MNALQRDLLSAGTESLGTSYESAAILAITSRSQAWAGWLSSRRSHTIEVSIGLGSVYEGGAGSSPGPRALRLPSSSGSEPVFRHSPQSSATPPRLAA